MFKLDPIRQGMPTYSSTPYNRGVGLTLGIAHIPVMLVWAFFTVTLWFFPIILFAPALVLFAGYWKIYNDRLPIRNVIQVWRWTAIFNVLLAILTIGFLINKPHFLIPALMFQVWSIFMAGSAYKELKRKHGKEYFEEAIEDWGYDIEYIEKDESVRPEREEYTYDVRRGRLFL